MELLIKINLQICAWQRWRSASSRSPSLRGGCSPPATSLAKWMELREA